MNAERIKESLISTYEPAKALCLWSGALVALVAAIIGGFILWYLPPVLKAQAHAAEAAAKQTEDVTGKLASVATRFDNIAAKVEARIDPILDNAEQGTGHLNRAFASVETRVPVILDNLGTAAGEATGLVADLRRDALPLLNQNLASLDRNQGEIGKSLPALTQGVTGAVQEFQLSAGEIRKSPGFLATFGESGSLVSLNRTMSGFEPIPGKLGLTFDRANVTLGDVNRMSKDAADKWHAILLPPPVHGFWPRVRQGLTYTIRPAAEGIRIYQQFSGLPVSLQQPISIIPK